MSPAGLFNLAGFFMVKFIPPDCRIRGDFTGVQLKSCCKTHEAIAKSQFHQDCHSERSEESRIFKELRSFTSFRMTEKRS
jgi:hypothetical protein